MGVQKALLTLFVWACFTMEKIFALKNGRRYTVYVNNTPFTPKLKHV